MVVDDMSTSRGLIVQALDAIGVQQVWTASDASTALRMMQANPVHLTISDYLMPQINGLELLRMMRAAPDTRRIGFILISGRLSDKMLDAGRKLGMNNFIQKPFSPGQLQNAIEAVVGRL